jgi:large subunit ribosomal protein L3
MCHANLISWKVKALPKEVNLLGFPGYKVSMTHVGLIDNFSHTLTKGTEISVPVTVVECPPVKVLSVKFLNEDEYGNLQIVKEVSSQIRDKYLSKKIDVSKKTSKVPSVDELISFAKENGVEQVRLKVVTEPSSTSTGKKKPDVIEIVSSGSIEDKIKFGIEKLGSEIRVSDVFSGGELVDSHGITTGKGFQGAVKRYGVKLTSHKSEKKRRHAGNVGAWTPSRVLTTQPLPGQHGFHERTEWNKWILKVSSDADEINPKQGFKKYGQVKSDFILVKGSIQGPSKRMVTLVRATRPNKRYPKVAPQITYVHK